jgi:hypothetical protein
MDFLKHTKNLRPATLGEDNTILKSKFMFEAKKETGFCKLFTWRRRKHSTQYYGIGDSDYRNIS